MPLRLLIPNLITLLALCAGLSAMRMAIEGKFDIAVYLVLLAALLDSMDGRIARLLKGTSKFGAELDSLADFVSFGAGPALILYLWGMNNAGPIGWIAVLVFSICGALRLARFNVQIEDPNRPAWMANYFTGVPIPAGAILLLLPLYIERSGLPNLLSPPLVTTVYTIIIALLMVSKVPVFSGKKLGARVPRDSVLPIFVAAIAFVPDLWIMPSGRDLLPIAILSLTGSGAQFCLAQAFRYGEVSLLAPLEYGVLIWATIFGYVFWGDLPTLTVLGGVAIIIASSAYVAHREARAKGATAVPDRDLI